MFQKVLDAEMKVLHACAGEDYAGKAAKAEREAITEEEEKEMWHAGVLGDKSPNTLLNTLYFYIGKLFGLGASEHPMFRLHNFVVSENAVSFVENVSKTYHGGLKDLKRNATNVKHYCHRDEDKEHNPCIVKLFKKYTSMISDLSRRNDAFYFRPSKTSYKFEDVPVRIHKLNSILPSLTTAAGLKRRTAHSLGVRCGSTLLQNNVEEKLIRERTGHISNALFRYEKPCEEQIKCVSECLGPPSVVIESDDCEEKLKIESGKEAAWFDYDLDEYLASLNYEELALLDSKDSKCESEVKDNKSEVQTSGVLVVFTEFICST